MKAILLFPLAGKFAKVEIKCHSRKQGQFWPPCYTWCFQYRFPPTAAFLTSFAPGFHNPEREKMNFPSQMLELLVQNVTKYQQLCQGTWGHRKKPFKRGLAGVQGVQLSPSLGFPWFKKCGEGCNYALCEAKGCAWQECLWERKEKTGAPKAAKGTWGSLLLLVATVTSQSSVQTHPRGT